MSCDRVQPGWPGSARGDAGRRRRDQRVADVGVYALTTAGVLAVTLGSSYLPARAAGAVDPIVVLRES